MFEQCQKVMGLMSNYGQPWAIAGGWAIDLHVGKETRKHADVEIAVFRDQQQELKRYLDSWEFKKVVNGEMLVWEGEELMLPIHELHGTYGVEEIEVLMNEVVDQEWVFRRDSNITFPAESLIQESPDGIPYLHPSVVLLYKAKHLREKDHQDFLSVKDRLDQWNKQWLIRALESHLPGHAWINYLGGIN
jgi:hypothetical protein